jgi:hypothetical protein
MSQLVPERRSRFAPDRWEPLSELEQMTERMRRMLDQTFGGLVGRTSRQRARDHGRSEAARAQRRTATEIEVKS